MKETQTIEVNRESEKSKINDCYYGSSAGESGGAGIRDGFGDCGSFGYLADIKRKEE